MEDRNNRVVGASFAAGGLLGALSGYLLTNWYHTHKTLHADDVLELVKAAFLKEGPIEGSWIEFTQEPFQKFAIKSKLYTGGITRLEDGELVQYEFKADAYTGTVLDIKRLA